MDNLKNFINRALVRLCTIQILRDQMLKAEKMTCRCWLHAIDKSGSAIMKTNRMMMMSRAKTGLLLDTDAALFHKIVQREKVLTFFYKGFSCRPAELLCHKVKYTGPSILPEIHPNKNYSDCKKAFVAECFYYSLFREKGK
jgi:hypothetical protein